MTESHAQFLNLLEREYFKRPLNSLEKFVLVQAWLGQNYNQIAQDSGYSIDYMKQIGSVLWGDLSKATGKTITKRK